MPPETYRWDRKRERSSESLGSYVSRWRDTPTHHRWGSPDFRRPFGHGRQGGWHSPFEASGHGFAPTRSIDNILDDEGCRPEGRYFRNNRENKVSFRQNHWKGQSWETATLANGPGRQVDVNSQRSVNDKRMFNSHSHSKFVNNCDKLDVKDTHDGNDDANGLGTGERFVRENSLGSIDLKSFKWTRSGSLSSRGSGGFSHSSSSKSIRIDINNPKVDIIQPVASPSGDATACVTSAAPKEDTTARKKPRLRWGEGLAKFEKKKVEVPDDDGTKNGMSVCCTDAEPLLSPVVDVADKSPRAETFVDCASPATPSSVACSSSPGTDEKSFVKSANVDNDTSNLSASTCPLSQNHSEDIGFDLANLDLISVPDLSSSLDKLLQSDDTSSLDSAFMHSSAMNKLMILKAGISKALEATESEIDTLENELKPLIDHCRSDCPCPAASSSLPMVCNKNPCDELCAPFDLISSRDMVMDKIPCAHEEGNGKDEGIDSPGTATSNSVETLDTGKSDSPSDIAFGDCNKLITGNSADSLSTEAVCCDRDITLYDLIATSNKDTANRVSEVFNKLLPSDQCSIDVSRTVGSSCLENDQLIMKKFVKRKHFLRFKERVLTLKYRAFQHLWKEDMRLVSMRRYCAKSQKRFEPSTRIGNNGHQKHRSSSRSRFSFPGNLSLVPTTEMIEFTSKLLSDSEFQICRSTLKMPAVRLDYKDKMVSRFISSNGLVEDSCAVEKEKLMINPWTFDEREIFMDKLATCGKDFSKIASFLTHKTTADCVEFYYKNHKSDWFQKIKKKPDCEKKAKSHSTNTYLVTSGKRWNRDINATSLDVLGAATAVAAAKVDDVILEMPGNLDDERETVAADVLAGICGSLSSEAMSSCITSSVDPTEGYQELKCHRVGSSTGHPLMPEVIQSVEDETCSDESYVEMTDSSNWTDQEKSIFVEAVSLCGKDFTMISRRIGTKSSDQCKVFFSKARKCLGLDMMHRGPVNGEILTSDDTNEDGSDTEDACLVETELGTKMDEEPYLTNLKGTHNVYPADLNRSEDCQEMELKSGKLVPREYDLKAELDFGGDTSTENCVGSGIPVLQLPHGNAFIPSDFEAALNEDNGHANVEKLGPTKDVNYSGEEAEREAAGEVSGECSGVAILGHELKLPERSSMQDAGTENSAATIALNGSKGYSTSARQSFGDAFLLKPESFHVSQMFDFDDLRRKHCQLTDSSDDQHQHLTLSDRTESSQILRGYPVSVSTLNGMNVDISCKRPALFQSIPEFDRNSHSDRYTSQNGFLQKCNSSKQNDSVAELQFLPHEQMRVDPRPQQLSLSDEAKPRMNGDVKLFGQILTGPASQHKPCSIKHENDDKVRQHPKLNGESSFNTKLKLDGKSALSKIDLNNNSGLEDVPVKSSYGYWDGNRIQTGFSSIPDSAVLLAKYPAAFSNYPRPSSNIRQQPLPSVVNQNVENSKGISGRQIRNCDVAKVQPFTVDMNQRQDLLFSQMQRRSEMNVVGREGGISDPVAAIKMHYAKTEQYRILER